MRSYFSKSAVSSGDQSEASSQRYEAAASDSNDISDDEIKDPMIDGLREVFDHFRLSFG